MRCAERLALAVFDAGPFDEIERIDAGKRFWIRDGQERAAEIVHQAGGELLALKTEAQKLVDLHGEERGKESVPPQQLALGLELGGDLLGDAVEPGGDDEVAAAP